MRQPLIHDKLHPNACDRWDPYRWRTSIHLLDDRHFRAMLDCDPDTGRCLHSVDALFDGCIDAPEEIPGGSTLGVRTIGDWDREHYRRLDRGQDDYKVTLRTEVELARLLKQILKETE